MNNYRNSPNPNSPLFPLIRIITAGLNNKILEIFKKLFKSSNAHWRRETWLHRIISTTCQCTSKIFSDSFIQMVSKVKLILLRLVGSSLLPFCKGHFVYPVYIKQWSRCNEVLTVKFDAYSWCKSINYG